MKYRIKNKVVLIILVLCLFLLISFYFLKTKNYIAQSDELYWRINNNKLTELKSISDQYITSQVGENRFFKEFILLSDKSQGDPSQKVEKLKNYRIAYEYLTVSELSGEREIIYVVIADGKVKSAYGINNCIKEPSKCDFKIDKSQAIEIAKKNDFITDNENYSVKLSYSGPKKDWIWGIHRENQKGLVCPEGGSYSILEISAASGLLFPIRNEGYCP